MTIKSCSKCGKEFGCKADERGCWCEGFTLPAEALAQLKADYDNCLCPDCLATYGVPKQQVPGDL